MESYQSNVPKEKIAEGSAKKQYVITIKDGSGLNKMYLTCDSWQNGIALLDQAMIQLDSIGFGLPT